MSQIFNIKLKAENINPKYPGLAAILGQKGIKPMDFCREFNEALAKVKIWKPGCLVTVKIDKRDGGFEILKISPFIFSDFVKEAVQKAKLTGKPGKDKKTYVSKEEVMKIAALKLVDSNTNDVESVFRSLVGSMRSCGVFVKD